MSDASQRGALRTSAPLLALVVAGVVVTAVGVARDPRDGWSSVLVAAIFGISIAIGAAIFTAVNGAAGAAWWLPIRRVPTAIMATLPIPVAALAIAFALGLHHLYPWAEAPGRAADGPAHGKELWLAAPAFLARAAVIVAAWLATVAWLRAAVADGAAVPEAKHRRARASIVFLVVLGPTIFLAFFDWGMSLEPRWSSTAYGVYGFAASFHAGIAAVALAAVVLRPREGDRPHRGASSAHASATPSARIFHDLGTLLFAFSIFWAYIWFCQAMLIWYANLPEEVPYYVRRLSGGWARLFWLAPLLCFVVPFIALLPRNAKQSRIVLGCVAAIVLAGRALDMYVLIVPARRAAPPTPAYAVGAVGAVLAGMALLVTRAWGARRGGEPPGEAPAGPPPAPPAPRDGAP